MGCARMLNGVHQKKLSCQDAHQSGLDASVGDRVGGHVEQEEVLLLRGQDALLRQVLGQALAHVLQLVPGNEMIEMMNKESFQGKPCT